jgi:hypothetical protein
MMRRLPIILIQPVLDQFSFPPDYFPFARYAATRGARVRQAKTSHLAISLEPAQVADSLCCGQETRMMRKHEIQIENSNSKSSNKFKN